MSNKISPEMRAVMDKAKPATFPLRQYVTGRGHALIYPYEPGEKPVLTLENYTKWYEIYLVMPDGSVQEVAIEDIMKVQDEYRDALWVDHLYHPRLLYRLAAAINAELDERAVEVATGRWILEREYIPTVETDQFQPPEE